jgi:hypothetical protein
MGMVGQRAMSGCYLLVSSPSVSGNKSRSGTLKATAAATKVATVRLAAPCSILIMCFG